MILYLHLESALCVFLTGHVRSGVNICVHFKTLGFKNERNMMFFTSLPVVLGGLAFSY